MGMDIILQLQVTYIRDKFKGLVRKRLARTDSQLRFTCIQYLEKEVFSGRVRDDFVTGKCA